MLLTPKEVDQRYSRLPSGLAHALLPFQREGVRFGLARAGRCLIADEMGVGKTLQAIALASRIEVRLALHRCWA
jgi:SNF2 family DNA or RNA helicase